MTDKRLLSYVERVEKLIAERSGINDDIRDVVTEATSAGYDGPTIRKLLTLRGMDASEREESEYLLDTYKSAIGMGVAPEPISNGSRLARAAEMFRAKKTVKQVAALMDLTNGTAGRLRKRCEALGLLKPIPSHIPRVRDADVIDIATGEITERTAVEYDTVPEGQAARGGESQPPRPEPIPPSAAGAAGHEDVLAADPSPPVAPPAPCADPPTPAADTRKPDDGDGGIAPDDDMPPIPAANRWGTPENRAARGRA